MNKNLDRFIRAQDISFDIALAEIKAGRKQSHWMWFIFPQIDGLGFSSTAKLYAIKDINEARAYMENEYLRKNLITICNALLELETSDPDYVFGYPDNMKLQSSMTLFNVVAPDVDVFQKVLDKYFDGKIDERTIEILKNKGNI